MLGEMNLKAALGVVVDLKAMLIRLPITPRLEEEEGWIR